MLPLYAGIFIVQGLYKIIPDEVAKWFFGGYKIVCKWSWSAKDMVANPHPSQNSKEVKGFWNKIGTTLCLLEQVTQWENLSELYVCLFK